jgi:hypothetical protein
VGPRHVWRIGDFGCGLETDLDGQERALELFVPWHAPAETAPDPDFTLRSLVDPDGLGRALEQARSRAQDEVLEVFAGETWLHRHRLADGRELFTEPSDDRHAFVRDGDVVTVLLAADEPGLRTYAVRRYSSR